VKPLSGRTYSLQLTMTSEMHDRLRHAQRLLSHTGARVPDVLDRALRVLIAQLEKRKFAHTDRPRSRRSPRRGLVHATGTQTNPRHIPAHVKRAVRERDADQCTYTNDAGQRCPARDHLEWDHVLPVALGGTSTIDNVRQRCRAHNQHVADLAFGPEFMRHKRARVQASTYLDALGTRVVPNLDAPLRGATLHTK
jgi:5-methylcytosine-specific restriction endonuclease McrA